MPMEASHENDSLLKGFCSSSFLELCNEKEILIPIEQLKIHTQNLS